MNDSKDFQNLLETKNENTEKPKKKGLLYFLPCKFTSFFYFGGKYLLMTYLVPFFISMNLNPAQAGIIISLRYLVQVIGGVLLSALADRTKKHTFIALLAICVATCSMIVLPVLPPTYISSSSNQGDSRLNITLNNSPVVEVHTSMSTRAENNISIHNDSITTKPFYKNRKINVTEVPSTDSTIFVICIICSLVYALFDGSLNGMVDAITIAYCDNYGDSNSYYWQRLWGSVGYATVPLLGGILLDYWTFERKYLEFIPVFYMFYGLQFVLFCSFMFLLNAYSKINRRDAQKEKRSSSNVQPNQFKKETSSGIQIFKTMTNSKILICLVLQIAFGIGTGIEFSYLLLYMEDFMTNGSKSTLGFAILSQCLTEAIFSPLLGRITKIIRDPYVCMSLGLAGYALGFFFYYCATSGIHIIFINIIYGFSYLIFNFPAQAECYRLCPKKYLTVLFSLSASCYTGIGCAIGGLIGGLLYERNGPRNMYLITSFMFQAVTAVLAIYCVVQFKKRRSTKEHIKDIFEVVCIGDETAVAMEQRLKI